MGESQLYRAASRKTDHTPKQHNQDNDKQHNQDNDFFLMSRKKLLKGQSPL